jgi:hypothetical protein
VVHGWLKSWRDGKVSPPRERRKGLSTYTTLLGEPENIGYPEKLHLSPSILMAMPLLILFLSQAADIITSIVGMQKFGTIESNPLFYNNFTALLFVKLGTCVAISALWFLFPRSHRIGGPVLYACSGVVFYVAFQNVQPWLR